MAPPAHEDSERAAAEYDALGDAYSRDSEDNPWNALHERPAMQAMVGEVRGQRVLDAGCGPGLLCDWLAGQGAEVSALDVSPEMVRLARVRLAGRTSVTVEQADLGKPLPSPSAAFDLVVASLVLHYLRDWSTPLAEFHRLLRPGGRLLASTHHPCAAYRSLSPDPNYHRVELLEDEWLKFGQPYPVRYYHRPLNEIIKPVLAAGFTLENVVEPLPVPECATRFPEENELLTKQPWLLFVEARKPG